MDPFTLALALAVAYIAFPLDDKTLRASRGIAGVGGAAVRGGASQYRAERARTAPARAKAAKASRAKWEKSGLKGKAAVAAKLGTRAAARSGGRALSRAGTSVAAAVKNAPSGYAPAAERAAERRATRTKARAEARARREERFRTPDSVPIPEPPIEGIPSTPKEPAVAVPSNHIRTTELETVGDLHREALRAADTVHELLDAVTAVRDYVVSLPERMADAPFGTQPIAAAVGTITEHVPDLATLQALEEALGSLLRAAEIASGIGEVTADQGATGRVEAYASA